MPGLVPGIHAAVPGEAVEGDARNKSGHDDMGGGHNGLGTRDAGADPGPDPAEPLENPVEAGPCALPAKAEPDSNGTSPGMTRRRHESEVEAAGMRRERKDPENGLARYLTEREGRTGEKYVGIATDGAEFIAFFLRDGRAVEVGGCRTEPEKPRKPSPLPGPAR